MAHTHTTGVLFESTAVETEQCASPTEPNHPADKMIPILPILRVPSNTHPIQGSHVAVSDGLYVIAWDNSYSRLVTLLKLFVDNLSIVFQDIC